MTALAANSNLPVFASWLLKQKPPGGCSAAGSPGGGFLAGSPRLAGLSPGRLLPALGSAAPHTRRTGCGLSSRGSGLLPWLLSPLTFSLLVKDCGVRLKPQRSGAGAVTMRNALEVSFMTGPRPPELGPRPLPAPGQDLFPHPAQLSPPRLPKPSCPWVWPPEVVLAARSPCSDLPAG